MKRSATPICSTRSGLSTPKLLLSEEHLHTKEVPTKFQLIGKDLKRVLKMQIATSDIREKIDCNGQFVDQIGGDITGLHDHDSLLLGNDRRLGHEGKSIFTDGMNFKDLKRVDVDEVFRVKVDEKGRDDHGRQVKPKPKLKPRLQHADGHHTENNVDGDKTDRSTDSFESVVGRQMQAENLRIKGVEQMLRTKLMSVVPGKNEFQKAFKFFDCDDSGTIDAAEFRRVFKRLNVPLTNAEANFLFKKYDENGNGKVEFYEFIGQFIPSDMNYNWRKFSSMGRTGFDRVHADLRVGKMVDLLRNEVGPRRLKEYFKSLGTPAPGKEGKLTLLDFVSGMEKAGYKLTSKLWGWMIEILDQDKSGFISADEFCYSFGTDEGNLEILNGPGEESRGLFNPIYKFRDDVVNQPPKAFKTQSGIPATVIPSKDHGGHGSPVHADSEEVPLDEDLTTCSQCIKGLKLDFRHAKVSLDQFFRKLDLDGSGYLSRKEFDQGLRRLGYKMSNNEICQLLRSFGVKEWEEGISKDQFNAMMSDDVCADYDSVRGGVGDDDGRSPIKMGKLVILPKGIQPDNGDRAHTPGGTQKIVKLDPLMRTYGPEGARRMQKYAPSPMANTLHPQRKTMKDPINALQGDDAIREALQMIQGFVEEKGLKKTFDWLDTNKNSYVTKEDLQTSMNKLDLSEETAEALCDFLDHNRDGSVSMKDFMATMSEVSKSFPDNRPEAGSWTCNIKQPWLGLDSNSRYTSRYDHGISNSLKVPKRYNSEYSNRRHHDTLDGHLGQSASGVAGVLQPRCDTPSFIDERERFKRKSTMWDAAADKAAKLEGRVMEPILNSSWQQQLVVADHAARNKLSYSRQNTMVEMRATGKSLQKQAEDRIDHRNDVKMTLKYQQKLRYLKTVFDPAFE